MQKTSIYEHNKKCMIQNKNNKYNKVTVQFLEYIWMIYLLYKNWKLHDLFATQLKKFAIPLSVIQRIFLAFYHLDLVS